MKDTKIEDFPLDKVRPSKTNPRTHFDEEALVELTKSVAAHGILQPLLARPDWCIGKTADQISKVNGQAPASQFVEIVAGERRYRAAVRAKLAFVPITVRPFSDLDALEIQLIENLQREDLDPFEEARGYRKLLDLRDDGKAVHTIATIHERTGKAPSRIYDRLKLLNVSPSMRQAVRDGLSVRIAEYVGAIPTKELRDRATAEILKPTLPQYGVGPLTVRQALEFIEEYFMRQLSSAQFDQKDPDLVPVIQDEGTGERIGGGACTDCPMRTGNMTALIGKTKRPDVCTNPQCFARKTDAHFAQLNKTALAEGKRVLTDAESRSAFDEHGRLQHDSPYVKLSDQPDRSQVRSDFAGKLPSWKKLWDSLPTEQSVEIPSTDQKTQKITMVKRTEKFAKPQIMIARDPRARIVELVELDSMLEAIKLASKQTGEKSIFDKAAPATSSGRSTSASSGTASGNRSGLGSGSGGSGGTDAAKAADRKKRDEAKLSFDITLASVSALIAAIDDRGTVKGFWDRLIEACITHASHDGCWLICKRHGLESKLGKAVPGIAREGVEGAALEFGLTLPDEKMKIGYVVELLLSQRVKFFQQLGGLREVKPFLAFTKLYGVDLAKVVKDVRAAAKKEEKPESNGAVTPGKMYWTRKPEGDFKFNQHGVCENPATLVLPFPKTTKCKVKLHLARWEAGWVSASVIESGVNSGGVGAYPSKSSARKYEVFPSAREALLHEAMRADLALVAFDVKPAVLKTFRAYVKEIKTMPTGEVISGNSPDAGKSKLTKIASAPAGHMWEMITATKYRCQGCGAAAVKVVGENSRGAESTKMGLLLVEKKFRGKPCSQAELPLSGGPSSPKKSRPAARKGLTPAMRKKLGAPARAKKNTSSRKATARRQSRKGGNK